MIKRVFKPESHHFANWVWIYDTISHRSLDSEGPSHPKWAPLHYAAQHGFLRVIEWLITTCSQDVNVSSFDSSTPLHIASRKGLFMVAQVLLAHHADVNARNHIDWTPLHFASRFEHPKLVRLLLEHSAVVDPKNWLRVTPLYLLLDSNGNMEVAQLLLEHGADPNVRSGTGMNSIYRVLKNGQLGLVQMLVNHGTDLNTRDVDGQTLLHLSSQRGDRKVAQELLILNVDLHLRDNKGRTPLQVALENGNEQVGQLLLRYGAKRTSPLRRGDPEEQVRYESLILNDACLIHDAIQQISLFDDDPRVTDTKDI
jgi:ankyrin repeat protein